jgi:hypothetical protein
MNTGHTQALRGIAAHPTGQAPDEAFMTAIHRLGFVFA